MMGYPKWFPRLLFVTVGFVFVCGCLLIPNMLDARLEWEVALKLAGGTRNLVGALHVAAGFLVAAILGAVWSVHMRHNWRLRLNRASGLGVAVVIGGLCLTGIGNLYLGGERSAPINTVVHTLIGLVVPVWLAIHTILGRRVTRARKAAAAARRDAKP